MAEGALFRVLRQVGGGQVRDLLVGLSGADLTTLLLDVMRRRAVRLDPSDVLRRYRDDRFVVPGVVPFMALRRAEDAALAALPSNFDVVTCSPVVPLGTHSVLATVDQNKVVTTIRGSEVAADPTNALALEAAARRRSTRDTKRDASHHAAGDSRSGGASSPRGTVVRLAAIQGVLRAQRFDGSAPAHFTLFGLASAGRDTGQLEFERQHLVEHLTALTGAASIAGPVQVRLTPLGPGDLPDEVAAGLAAGLAGVEVTCDRGRRSGRGYYRRLCFKVYVRFAGDWLEVGDGGFVDWTQRLLSDRKERLLISGLGLDRLAEAASRQG